MGTGGLPTLISSKLRSSGNISLMGIDSRSSSCFCLLAFLSPRRASMRDFDPSSALTVSSWLSELFPFLLTAIFLGATGLDLDGAARVFFSRVWLRAAQKRQTGVLCHCAAGDSWRRSIGGAGRRERAGGVAHTMEVTLGRDCTENMSAFVNAGRSLRSPCDVQPGVDAWNATRYQRPTWNPPLLVVSRPYCAAYILSCHFPANAV